jgi:hypothetical protein
MLHENGHSNLRIGNEGEKIKIGHGEKRKKKERGRGSRFWSGATWENGGLVTI